LEDNIERLNQSIHLAKSSIESPNRNESTTRQALTALADADVLLQKVTRHLDFATDPELDLAFEVGRLRERNRWLQVQVNGHEEALEGAKRRVEDAENAAKQAQEEMRDERRKRRGVEKELEQIGFEGQLGRYLSDRALERHRR